MPRHPKSALDRATELKVRQLQQYLHRSGLIPASTHPVVKQALSNRLRLVKPKPRSLIKSPELKGGKTV